MDASITEFPYKKITVTGGAGFLGRHLVQRLKDRGADVFVPRSRDYNLVKEADVARLLDEARPEMVIHLAAVVGGIGYNQKNPGRHLVQRLKDRGADVFVPRSRDYNLVKEADVARLLDEARPEHVIHLVIVAA